MGLLRAEATSGALCEAGKMTMNMDTYTLNLNLIGERELAKGLYG